MQSNKELADKLSKMSDELYESKGGTSIGTLHHSNVLALSVAADYIRSLPDPVEPEYGWGKLAFDLRVSGQGDWDNGPEIDRDALRGTAVRLMREKGFTVLGMEHRNNQWEWSYDTTNSSSPVGNEFAPSEPAAYRDMLKHAGIL